MLVCDEDWSFALMPAGAKQETGRVESIRLIEWKSTYHEGTQIAHPQTAFEHVMGDMIKKIFSRHIAVRGRQAGGGLTCVVQNDELQLKQKRSVLPNGH